MGNRTHKRLKQTDLFLVRVWLGEPTPGSISSVTGEWHGRVQRVVDGESHQFEDWKGLVEVLTEMLAEIEPGQE